MRQKAQCVDGRQDEGVVGQATAADEFKRKKVRPRTVRTEKGNNTVFYANVAGSGMTISSIRRGTVAGESAPNPTMNPPGYIYQFTAVICINGGQHIYSSLVAVRMALGHLWAETTIAGGRARGRASGE